MTLSREARQLFTLQKEARGSDVRLSAASAAAASLGGAAVSALPQVRALAREPRNAQGTMCVVRRRRLRVDQRCWEASCGTGRGSASTGFG